jgi:outer membrane protein TolC
MSITPMQIEKRLTDLSREIDQGHAELVAAEQEYHSKKASLEIGMARARMSVSHPDMKLTSVQREDEALIRNEEAHLNLAIAEAQVKAARANVNRIRTQVDIARSISVSVRSSLDL